MIKLILFEGFICGLSVGFFRKPVPAIISIVVCNILYILSQRKRKVPNHKPIAQMTGLEFEEYCAKYLMQTGRFMKS